MCAGPGGWGHQDVGRGISGPRGRRGRWLVLDVRDDGSGLPDTYGHDGTGLQAMRSRAASLGGVLRVGPRLDGRGTHVYLEIPQPEGAHPWSASWSSTIIPPRAPG